jgi:apolipoprotein N-acyltransferase
MKNRIRWIMITAGGIMASIPWWSQAWPLLLICFIPLLLVENDIRNEKGGFASVLPFAFGFFLLWNLFATWWLARIHFAGGMSVIILNASVMCLVFLLFSEIKKTAGGGVAVFVILWTAFEFLHHRGDLSWPWLSLGNGLAGSTRLIQWYEYTGMTGGTLWVLAVNGMLFTGITQYHLFSREKKAIMVRAVVLGISVVLPPLFSLYMYEKYDTPGTGTENKGFLVLQTAFDPYTDKFTGMSNRERLEKLIGMAGENMGPGVDIIVAPETSVDSVWIDDPGDMVILRFSEFLEEYRSTIFVAGATTFHYIPSGEKEVTSRQDSRGRYYEVQNSALLLGPGSLQAAYHKHHLANGVEQIPFHRFTGLLRWLTVDLGGVSGSLKPGVGAVVFSPGHEGHGAWPLTGILICFESSYGEYAARMVRKGAEILIVISNDGWFKNTGAYRQHLRMAVIRAIETRRDIVRAANFGFSGLITGRGDINDCLEPGEEGTVLVNPAPNDQTTFFVRSGDYTGRAALFFSLLLVLNYLVRRFSTAL